MYKCHICQTTSAPKESLRRHVVYRPDKSVARELPVCGGCDGFLKAGVPYEILLRQGGRPIRHYGRDRLAKAGRNGSH